MGKEEGWPIKFITSKVRYNGHRKKKNTAPGRSIAIYGLYKFIVHPKYFAISDWLQSSGHFFHKQLAFTIFERCEQCIIDAMVYLGCSMVYLHEIGGA